MIPQIDPNAAAIREADVARLRAVTEAVLRLPDIVPEDLSRNAVPTAELAALIRDARNAARSGDLPSAEPVTLHVWIPAIQQAIECLSRDDCPEGLRGDAAGRLEALKDALQATPADLPSASKARACGSVDDKIAAAQKEADERHAKVGPPHHIGEPTEMTKPADLPPHPDTERLDWLCDSSKVCYITVQTQPHGYEAIVGHGTGIRAAIDAARNGGAK